MPYYDPIKTFVPKTSYGVSEQVQEPGNVLLGWHGGLLKEFSEDRGPSLPPTPYDLEGIVESYETYDNGKKARLLAQINKLDAQNNIIGRYNFGPLSTMAIAPAFDDWWGENDWMRGEVIHFYDSNLTDSTAIGQWAILEDRDPEDAWKFNLQYPLRFAPQPGDKFAFGSLAWAVCAQAAATPGAGRVGLKKGNLGVRKLAAEPMWARIEAYPSGDTYNAPLPSPTARSVNGLFPLLPSLIPPYPFQPDAIVIHQVGEEEIFQVGSWSFASANRDGVCARAREISMAFATLVNRQDFTVNFLAGLFELESGEDLVR